MPSSGFIDLQKMRFFLDGVIPVRAQILLYGPKGSGKSTAGGQLGDAARSAGFRVGYLLTEQTTDDHAEMLRSLGINTEFDVRELSDPAALVPWSDVDLLVVDSINGLGLIHSQARYRPIIHFMQLFRRRGICTLLVSHQTKAGTAAGPSALQHAVDAVVRLSTAGGNYILEVEKRRRLGPWASPAFTRVVPLVLGPRGFSPSPHTEPTVGTAIGFARGELVTVQALVCLPPHRLHCPFLPTRRIEQLLETLRQTAGVDADLKHIGVSVLASGAYGPTLDLALGVAVTASYLHEKLPGGVAFVGSVRLDGLIDPVDGAVTALAAALAETTIARVFVSARSEALMRELVSQSVEVMGVASLADCIARVRNSP